MKITGEGTTIKKINVYLPRFIVVGMKLLIALRLPNFFETVFRSLHKRACVNIWDLWWASGTGTGFTASTSVFAYHSSNASCSFVTPPELLL